ncbi:DNA primase DnaG [Halorubrum lacusprofundi]|jgi:DNA primase|uniref:DNA primase DnaG n=1 Tax=Halorubrum lacusprofundi (strain ATCC 49239 / DSM 5036 / JCM 8891 / ACAM 34) TaxID=416348 RepID=DNAG_HALLT|nr:DNA primase DnaG [Halorubrum lacusprofundi]B9LR58.1 RecName: Full=DNA primase DnaG [Halorubrum lacusprofundi ATCC 49239]ACM57712.1 TOPRIM domain protein [Halorubrum lacusprofundi ATCC 49239]MCG1005691.1 DNA primase [Halorubrum lacusprofundi]
MKDTEKYLIHANIAADGVVERSDVVGAVFGQTEGLLGDELDLRDLQESSRVGRIDVAVESENGQSFGEVTVASSLDKVETAILAAALETIDRIGPCHASVEVTSIEDVRAAKRREVVERAKELVAGGFEETSLASDDILDEVREAARVEGIVDYEGLPAGPRVGDSDAVIVVEGRADVLTLLECGIKNAVAVEGTNVPDAVADLTADRTVTAFLDGDRGGELILRELAQVGDVDYVAFAPPGESVEDLDRNTVFEALRGKVPYSSLADEPNLREAATDDSGSAPIDNEGRGRSGEMSEPSESETESERASDGGDDGDAGVVAGGARSATDRGLVDAVEDTPAPAATDAGEVDEVGEDREGDMESDSDTADINDAEFDDRAADDPNLDEAADAESVEETDAPLDNEPRSIEEHVQEIVDAGSDRARLLGDDRGVLAEIDAVDAFDAIEDAETAPHTVVVDGLIDQRLLDVAAQRGVSELLGREVGEFVKRPVGTRVLTVGDLRTGS